MSVKNVLPRPFFGKVTLSSKNTGSVSSSIYKNPHISQSVYEEYYGNVETEGENLVDVRVNVSLYDYIIPDKSKRSKIIKSFLKENFNIYVLQITDKSLISLLKDESKYHVFYNTFFHIIGSKVLSLEYQNENREDIDIILRARSNNDLVDRMFSLSDLTPFIYSVNEVDDTGTQIGSKYNTHVNYQYDNRKEDVAYFTFVDLDPDNLDMMPVNQQNELISLLNRRELAIIVDNKELVYDKALDLRHIEDSVVPVDYTQYHNSASVLNNNVYSRLYDGIYEDLRHTNIFDDIIISYNDDDSVGAIFGIDFVNLLRSSSKYYNVLKNEVNAEEILRRTKIEEIKVFRRRTRPVKSHNRLGSVVYSYEDFDEYDGLFDELIAVSKDGGDGHLMESRSDSGSIKQIEIYNNSDGAVGYYSFTDKKIKDITDGYYKYGVRLKYKDGVRDYILSKYNSFRLQKSYFEKEYYSDIFDRSNYDVKTESLKSGYIKYVNTVRFRSDSRPWDLVFNSLVSLLEVLYGRNNTIESISFWSFINNMYGFIKPETCTVSSLGVFVKYIDDLDGIVRKFLSLSPVTVNNGQFNSNISSREKGNVLERWFTNEIVDSNFDRKGVSYLDPKDFLPDFEKYIPSIPTEDIPNIVQNSSKSSQIAPRTLLFGEKVFGLGEDNPSLSRGILGSIVNSSVGGDIQGNSVRDFYSGGIESSSAGIEKTEVGFVNVGVGTLSGLGITIDDINDPMSPTGNITGNIAPVTSYDEYIVNDYDVGNSGSSGEDSLDNSRLAKDSILKSTKNEEESGLVLTKISNNSNVIGGIVNSAIDYGDAYIQGYSDSNSQAGAKSEMIIAPLREDFTYVGVDSDVSDVYGAQYQIFEGYEKFDGEDFRNIRRKIWRTVLPSDFVNFVTSIEKPILVRISNDEERLKGSGLSLPIYNKYFIVDPKGKNE